MVLVFDEDEEQIPQYQGKYYEVKKCILENAPPETVFGQWLDFEADITTIPREEW